MVEDKGFLMLPLHEEWTGPVNDVFFGRIFVELHLSKRAQLDRSFVPQKASMRD